jgi:SAM-dependent methyltransferase
MVNRLLDRYYPMTSEGIRFRNGTRPFYDWLLEAIPPSATVLNIGAGPTPDRGRRLRGRFARLVGVDPDPVVLTNTDLDEAYVNDGVHLPVPDGFFDAAYSDWTLEHVNEPVGFLKEVHRVLKPGTSFWSRTVNRRHYMTLVSAHTPHWFHRLVANRARRLSPELHEPWPTRYRLNNLGTLHRLAAKSGFGRVEVRMIEPEPSYLMFHPAAFLVGVGYERLVSHFQLLAGFRLILLVRMSR